MSLAAATRTIKFISKAGTYTAQIMSPSGDLYQEYTGEQSNPQSLTPNFEDTKPVLYFVCTSSRSSESVVTPNSISFYFNDTKIEFSSETQISTGQFEGCFKLLYPVEQMPFGIQILKNIADKAGYVSCVIKAVAGITYGNSTDSIQASYTISIGKSEGTGYRVTIAAGDDKYFVIKKSGDSCILKAVVTSAGKPVTSGLSYQWYKMGSSGWGKMPTATGATLTVSASQVDVYSNFKVEVRIKGKVVASDEQSVMDASDPDIIVPNPVPKDETIYEDVEGSHVTYTPKVVRRGTNTTTYYGKFLFQVRSATGNFLSPENPEPATSFTVTRDMCVQGGGDVSITIYTEK